MTDYFNTESFLRSSFDNEKSHQQDMIEITQHLAPEQYSYEFPPKSCIMALAANDDPDEYSFFDECSFTSNSTAAFLYDQDDYDDYDTFDNADELLDQYLDSFHTSSIVVADNQLSPLQLPVQASYQQRPIREESCDSNGTITIRQPVRPSSFLSAPHHQQHYLSTLSESERINWDETSFVFPDYSTPEQQNGFHSIHPFSRRNSYDSVDDDDEDVDDDVSSSFSSQSKVIFMKISKNHVSPPTFIHYSQGSYISTDEGYDDDEDDCKELPIESASFFLPLSADSVLDRDTAATKIQSVWRGYISRKHQKPGVSHRVLAGLAHINDSIHRRNYKQLSRKHELLQQKLDKETAMRMAFEKTMEDMTILMDHQHSVLHDRLEQEVEMRQAYERKMDQTMAQIQPLEARLRHEAKARADLESMMSRVIDQLQDLRMQVREQAEQKQTLQLKLDHANNELKTRESPSRAASVRATTTTAKTSVLRQTTTPSSKTSSLRSTTTPSRTSVRNTATPTSRTSVRNTATPTSRTSVRSTVTPSRTSARSTTTTTTTTRNTAPSRLSNRSIVSRK